MLRLASFASSAKLLSFSPDLDRVININFIAVLKCQNNKLYQIYPAIELSGSLNGFCVAVQICQKML